MTTKDLLSSEYFTLNAHSGEQLASKRKRAAKTIADSEKLNGNDGSAVVDSAKTARPRRGKRQSDETAKETVKRETHKKRVESEVRSKTEIDVQVASVQSCSASCSFAPEASFDEDNDTSSSDAEWEDVEGSSFGSM